MKKIPLGKLLPALLLAAAALLALTSCGSSTAVTTATMPPMTMPPTTSSQAAAPSTSAPTGPSVSIDLTAQKLAFDKDTITVPAGAAVTINFDNKDSGVPHNFSLYTDSSASKSIFVGQVISGPKTIAYTFTAPSQPGTYFFRCDVHPAIMNGKFIVQ